MFRKEVDIFNHARIRKHKIDSMVKLEDSVEDGR